MWYYFDSARCDIHIGEIIGDAANDSCVRWIHDAAGGSHLYGGYEFQYVFAAFVRWRQSFVSKEKNGWWWWWWWDDVVDGLMQSV